MGLSFLYHWRKDELERKKLRLALKCIMFNG